jgi:Family of unknown function (DUF6062)
MDKSRFYFKLLEALADPTCPICALLLEDSHSYLDALFYESVLDVPTRMNLMESFGFCNWHARQIPSLPSICAPNVGFAIFASDLLRKLDYVGRAITEERARSWKWKSWFGRNRRRLIAFLKERQCLACDHVKQFESYHLNDLMQSLGDKEFFDAYQASRGICLPHFLILEEMFSSHSNFSLLFEAQLAKGKALRNTLEEFIRKQDFRFSDQITSEESTAWQAALEMLTGSPGIFANEMGHDLFQRSRAKKASLVEPLPTRSSFSLNGRVELMAGLKSAAHVTLYLRKPLPEVLFQSLKQLGEVSARGAIEVVVEDLPDVSYLRSLHEANLSVFYGLGLPQQTMILVDRKKGFLLEEDEKKSTWRLRALKNPEDLSLTMIWHKFGNAVSLHGVVDQRDCAKGLFCVATDGKREQWCRFTDPVANRIPGVGTSVEIFGWEKWHTGIIEVLQLIGRG